MALVMLPCNLPWWGEVQKQLRKLENTTSATELIEGMHKIYDLCSASLDPEEEIPDPHRFTGFLNFLENDFDTEEKNNFLEKTLPNIIKRALSLKAWKPKGGLHFSLQQQSDATELGYNFISSLIANAFFSTFPKRTDQSHPTLNNFNFCYFFKHLGTLSQKAKLRSILHYFDWLENDGNSDGSIKIMRQVMTSKEWLTIEDWLECTLPLCNVTIRHEGRLERAETDSLHICFSSSKIGSDVLEKGNSQECINFATYPEILPILLNVEALEDNEVLTIESVRKISKIIEPKRRAFFEKLDSKSKVTICCMDAENYTSLPISQYEEDNILRELNKCLLAFQQKQTTSENHTPQPAYRQRRLSPIGESISSTPPELSKIPIITQDSCSTNKSSTSSILDNNNVKTGTNKLRVGLEMDRKLLREAKLSEEMVVNNRRGRFIVLGSSGEHLPTKRYQSKSNTSSEEEFHSAKSSIGEGSSDDESNRQYTVDLENQEARRSFAQRLKDALQREASNGSSSDSNYAVGISVTGSGLADHDFELKRGGSTGFMLHQESVDDEFLKSSMNKEQEWLDRFKTKQAALSKRESSRSTDYSFSTEYSSELEEVYEQFSRWLEDPILETEGETTKRELSSRDLAVVQFAGLLLKRTLSDSFAGIPMTEICDNTLDCNIDDYGSKKRNKLVLNAKSLSLELAKHKHRLAAQLQKTKVNEEAESNDDFTKKKRWAIAVVTNIVQTLEDISIKLDTPKLSEISQKPHSGLRPVSTGNWGCGSRCGGDVQLKVIIQWLAASVAGVPFLVYYTAGHLDLAKLDTVCRILIDRKWSVRDLAEATLRYSGQVLHGRETSNSLFEEIIGVDRSA